MEDMLNSPILWGASGSGPLGHRVEGVWMGAGVPQPSGS